MNRSVKKPKEMIAISKKVPLFPTFLSLLTRINKTHISAVLILLVLVGIFASCIPQDLYAQGEAIGGDYQAVETITANNEDDADTFGGWFGDKVYNLVVAVITYICIKLLALLSLLAIIAGSIFDYTVEFTITDLTANLEGLGDGIKDTWTVLRDLANMLFIFVLLYISIATILQLGGMQTKRLLKNVIIIALLINFSMFFTHIIIDVTNSVAVAFHGAARQVAVEGAIAKGSYDANKPPNISHSFLASSKITSIYKDDNGEYLKQVAKGSISGLLGMVAVGGVFIIVLSFVLFAGAFFLIARLVMFIILIILSPLAFIAAILPQTSSMFKKWSESLTHNALFAPMFMALLYASLKVLQASDEKNIIDTSNSNLASATQGTVNTVSGTTSYDPNTAAVMFQTILVLGLLFASLMVAKSLSMHGANRATAIGSKWGKAALGASTAGLAARGARRTIGAGAARVRDSERMKKWSSNESNPFMAKMATMGLGAADKTAKSSFDVRATGVAGDNLGKSGGKGGYDAIRDKKVKKEKERMKRVAPSDRAIGNAQIDLERYQHAHDEAKASGDEYRIKTTEESLRKAQEKNDRIKGVSEKQAQERHKETREKAEKELGTKDTDRSNMAPEEVQELERKIEGRVKEIAQKEGKTLERLTSAKERRQSAYKNIGGSNIFHKPQADIRMALEKELKKKPEDKQKEDIVAAVKEEVGKQQSS